MSGVRCQSETGESGAADARRDPFDAVPVKHERAEHREDSKGCYQLRMRLESGKGLGARLAHRLGLHRDVRVDLDEHGSFFWEQIDGKRDLHAIETILRERFSLESEQSRKATITFTKMLMERHLIQLKIEN